MMDLYDRRWLWMHLSFVGFHLTCETKMSSISLFIHYIHVFSLRNPWPLNTVLFYYHISLFFWSLAHKIFPVCLEGDHYFLTCSFYRISSFILQYFRYFLSVLLHFFLMLGFDACSSQSPLTCFRGTSKNVMSVFIFFATLYSVLSKIRLALIHGLLSIDFYDFFSSLSDIFF